MNKNLGIKLAIILATLLVFTAGIFVGGPENWKKSVEAIGKDGIRAGVAQNIHLGLDLQGGTHLILQVMVDEAVASETDRAINRLQEDLRTKSVAFTQLIRKQDRPDQFEITGISLNDVGTVHDLITDQFRDYDFGSGENGSLLVTMKPANVSDLKHQAVTRSIETIRSRVDALGVSEPVIQEHGLGDYQIMVQLPGIDDPIRVRQIMQETGMLEFRLVLGGPYTTRGEAGTNAASLGGVVMEDRTGKAGEGFYVLSRTAAVSGEDIRSATPAMSEAGLQRVDFTLKVDAGKRFGRFTEANIEKPMAVILNNTVREVANIKGKIEDQGYIEGKFSRQEVQDLSKMLESGALPASIRYLEDRTVGASLGADSIKQGVTAAIVGMGLVMVFMLVYYKGAGINANLGLILNLVILLGFLGFSGATLTLPGIAGVILTIGMGVDSNVLIFERIREEMRGGKPAATSVDHGFGRAWLTIIDTHITTIVSALILFLFGTGPVRGFAITLAFGLFANLFTAVFVSRVIFDKILQGKQRGEALSI